MKRPVLKLCRCAAAVLFAALLAALFAGCIRIGDTDSDKQSPAGKTDRYVWQNSHGATFSTCHTCGGDGLEQCTLCHGAGQYYANGGMNTCSGCFGRGTKKCTSCIGGRVTGTNCHGRGTSPAATVFGLGK